jgi:hypothetical protein
MAVSEDAAILMYKDVSDTSKNSCIRGKKRSHECTNKQSIFNESGVLTPTCKIPQSQ